MEKKLKMLKFSIGKLPHGKGKSSNGKTKVKGMRQAADDFETHSSNVDNESMM